MGTETKTILICTSSIVEFDRRMQRIALALHENAYRVIWIGRTDENNGSTFPYQVNSISCWNKKGALFYAEFNLRLLFRILFLRTRIDLINSIDLDTILASYVAGKIRSTTIVFDAHEYYTEVPELIGRKRVKSIWNAIADFTLRKIKYNYTVNHSLAKVFSNKYQQDYSVIRNVPRSKSNLKANYDKERTIVYLGVLNKGRGIELMLKSLIQLKDYKLWLLGRGDLEEEIKVMAKDLHVEPRVRFFDWVKPDEIHDILIKARIGLNILEPLSESYRLSLANKFFDYMHAGLPSINMNFPEYAYLIEKEKTGILINKLDENELVRAIRTLEDAEYYLELSNNCIKSSKVYNWESEEKKLIELYRNYLNV